MAKKKKPDIARFLDERGKITALPAKHALRGLVLAYLADKFEVGRDYREKEINAICDEWHTFGDFYLLRREMVDRGLLCRLPDGSRYWREERQPASE